MPFETQIHQKKRLNLYQLPKNQSVDLRQRKLGGLNF